MWCGCGLLSEAHTFDFIGSDQEPVRDVGAERALVEPLGPKRSILVIFRTNVTSVCVFITGEGESQNREMGRLLAQARARS